MIVEVEIRNQLARFLSNPQLLDEFEDWIASNSWNMHKDSSVAAQKLASAIELRLAEYSGGHIDFQTLRRELVPFVTNIYVSIPVENGQIILSTSMDAPVICSPGVPSQAGYVGTKLVVESC